ncbi:MAG: hypothetical protein HY683_09100 [Chloroflexi bacterium]|nr:hypothetical protein [Chloroflexota bacterium]
MKVTVEEYQRGILFWDMDAKAKFWTSTSQTMGEQTQWSGPLTDPNGSKVQSLPYRFCNLRCSVDDRSALDRQFQIRWERLINNVVVTRVWDNDLTGAPTTLKHVPCYGRFHRLVVATPYLAWSEDTILRVQNLIVRFTEGKVKGERVEPYDQVDVADGTLSITGLPVGSAEAEGRFIEVVAPGQSAERAEALAYTVLGLTGVCVGDHAIGEVVFSESYEATQGHQFGTLRIPVVAKFPREAEHAELEVISGTLPVLLQNGRMNRATSLALRWYERGARAGTPLDKFLAYFIGIETILNAYAAEHGPIPEVLDRETRVERILSALQGDFSSEELGLARQRLVESTLTERAKFYVVEHHWNAYLVEKFRLLARLRSNAVHGDATDIDESRVSEAHKFLFGLLKAELCLGDLAWETLPTISRFDLRYELLLQKLQQQ